MAATGELQENLSDSISPYIPRTLPLNWPYVFGSQSLVFRINLCFHSNCILIYFVVNVKYMVPCY
jgi:hypothetical protein